MCALCALQMSAAASLSEACERGAWAAAEARAASLPPPALAGALVARDGLGRCALHWAAAGAPRALALRLFLAAAGAAGEAVTQSGETPLLWLCEREGAASEAEAAAVPLHALVSAALAAGVDPAARSAASGKSAADALRARAAAGVREAARGLEVIEAALAAPSGSSGAAASAAAPLAVAAAVVSAPGAAPTKPRLKITLRK